MQVSASSAEVITQLPVLSPRPPDSNKGNFGRVLVVAGSRGMSGAAVLCANAALRGGAGLVKLAVPLSELTRYPVITNQVQVTESPTLVLIDGRRKADLLTGYLDQLELAQRVSDALAVK